MASLRERREQATARGASTPQRLRALLWASWLALGLLVLTSEANQRAIQQAYQLPAEAEITALRASVPALRAYQSAHTQAARSQGETAAAEDDRRAEQALRDQLRTQLDEASLTRQARQLAAAHQTTLERARDLLLASWTLCLLTLLLSQVYLSWRTRRALHTPLLAATALVVALGVMQTRDNAHAHSLVAQLPERLSAPASPAPARPLAPLGTAFAATLLWLGLWSRWREYES